LLFNALKGVKGYLKN